MRIPVEGLLGVALLLVLPPRIGRALAVVGGAALGALTILKVVDMGFLSALGRPFDPVFDWVLLDNAREFLEASYGSTGATAAAVAAVVLTVVVVVVLALAMLQISRAVGRHRPTATRSVAALSVAWVACLALGAQLVAPVPVASRSAASLAYDMAVQVPASLRDERVFAQESAADAFRGTAPIRTADGAARQGRRRGVRRELRAQRGRGPAASRRRWTPCSTPGPRRSPPPASPPAAGGSPRPCSAAAAGSRTPRSRPA